ncbi:reverse transcriptase domain-containing protein [Tanacetum coccineum]
MSIQLADRSIKYPIRVCENLLLKVGKFIFPVDFVVLEMDEDELVSIILGRPFLATARAVIDVHEGKLILRVENETITFNIEKSMKKWTKEEEEGDSNIALTVSFYPRTVPVEPLEWKTPDNRLKPSSVEPPELELKELHEHLEYAFLQENNQLPMVISSALSTDEKTRLLEVLRNHKGAIACSIADIKGINSSFCTNKILMEDEFKPSVQPQRRCVGKPCPGYPKEGGMTVVKNEKDELIPQRTITRWRICIDYRKLNNATWKDHFPLPFIDQMLERLAGHEYYCFLDGFSGYFQIPVILEDPEKTTFTCPYGTFAYRRMPFRLCNASATFQRCMTAIFHELIEDSMEVFMDDFSVFGSSFNHCLKNLEKMLKRCEETHLILNWEKCHFMVKKGIVLGHKVSGSGIEVDKAKIKLLVKDAPFNFFEECIQAFYIIKRELTQAPIMIKPDWSLPFEIMCDASDYAVEAKELLAVVFTFDKFRQYLVLSKTIVFTDHSALRYLFTKQDAKPRLIRWILLLQEFDIKIRDKRGAENLAADHLS